MSGWNTKKYYLHSHNKYGLHLMCSGIYVQYNNECRDLYNLRFCLYSRINLSVYSLYCEYE